MNEALESILEECLSQLAAGEATVQDCLAAYPQAAGELRPLLLASEGLRAVRKPPLPHAPKVRIQAQVLDAFDAQMAARPEPSRRPQRRPTWRWLPVGLAAAAACVLVLMTVIGLAQSALPGSPLYGVKRAAEDVRLWVASAEAEPALRLRFAQRRLDEMEALAARGEVDLPLVEALVREAEIVLAEAEGLPAAQALPVTEELARLTNRMTQVLNNLLASGANVPRDRILLALATTQELMGRAQALMEELRNQVPATATPTPVPTDTLRPGETPSPTWTPSPAWTPSPTWTPSPIPTSGAGEPPPPTSTPADGAEPEPTGKTPPAWGLTKTAEPVGPTRNPKKTITPEAGSLATPTPTGMAKDKSKGVGKGVGK